MNARTEAQQTVIAIATAEFGRGKGIDNATTGALLLYIQELEASVRSYKQEADENWRAAAGAYQDSPLPWRPL